MRTSALLHTVSKFELSAWLVKNLTMIGFLAMLAILYIANAHQAESNVRKIQVMQREVQDLRWSYMSLQSENMFNSLRSEVVNKVQEDGLQLQRGTPLKIVVGNNDSK